MKKIINKLFAGSLLAGMMLVSSCAVTIWIQHLQTQPEQPMP